MEERKCEDPKPQRKRLPPEPPKATKERAALRAFESLGCVSILRRGPPLRDFIIHGEL